MHLFPLYNIILSTQGRGGGGYSRLLVMARWKWGQKFYTSTVNTPKISVRLKVDTKKPNGPECNPKKSLFQHENEYTGFHFWPNSKIFHPKKSQPIIFKAPQKKSSESLPLIWYTWVPLSSPPHQSSLKWQLNTNYTWPVNNILIDWSHPNSGLTHPSVRRGLFHAQAETNHKRRLRDWRA